MSIEEDYSTLTLQPGELPCVLKSLKGFSTPYKIEIGSGENPVQPLDEWIHTDAHVKMSSYNTHTEVLCYSYTTPFEDNSVKEIACLGTWEHFTYKECMASLVEWDRILIKNGTILFNFPPVDHAVRLFLNGKVDFEWVAHAVYGWQRFQGDEHKSGWTLSYIQEWIYKRWGDIFNIEEIFWGDSRRNGSKPFRFVPNDPLFENYADPYDYPGAHVWVKLRKVR